MNIDNVPLDWRSLILVPLFKDKDDKGKGKEFKNFRGINLLSLPAKLYRGVVIEILR
jgi:hypothetical protein